MRAPGAAVLRRQGLRRDAPPRQEGVRARAGPVPGDARRHRPQLPRGDRVPRPPRRASSTCASSSRACRTRSTRAASPTRARSGRATACRRCRCSTRSPSNKFDAAFGGARRDEDKARAKERILSFRDAFGQWDPRNQRPELWRLYNPRVRPGEHLRAFPLSDWTEVDIWRYVAANDIELPAMYYSHRRTVVERDGMLLAVGDVDAARRSARSRSRRRSATAPSAT